MRILFITFLLLASIFSGYAQKKSAPVLKQVKIRGGSYIMVGNASIYIPKDTILFLHDSIASKLDYGPKRTTNGDDFYLKLRDRLYKTKITKEVYNLFFIDPTKKTIKKVSQPEFDEDYDKYAGKTIQNITVVKPQVFGTSVQDTTQQKTSWVGKQANQLHVYTRSRIIRNNLFFTEGDQIDPNMLRDSERILRNLPYIKDARVIVLPLEDSEAVDILVIVKDIWSISAEFSIDAVDDVDLTLTDKNFLGLGHAFQNTILFDKADIPNFGYNGTYRVNNLYNTFITAELQYANSSPLDKLGISLYRGFVTPNTKYAGGIDLNKTNIEQSRVFEDTTITYYTKFNYQNWWLGRSFMIDESKKHGRTNIQFAARYTKTSYLDRPLVSADTNQVFFDHKRYFFSIGFTRRKYEESSLISGYGRTEDIPIGDLLQFTAGHESNEFYQRKYIGARMSSGRYYPRVGYLRPEIAWGGFIREGKMEQGAFNIKVNYFSYLYHLNRVRIRQFLSLDYLVGIRRYESEFININDRNGVRGLSNVFLRGNKRLSFNAETVAFTPFYVMGFRCALYGFLDFGMVNDNNRQLLKNKLYQGYGIGVRLRNENVALNTIRIRLGWYPVVPDGNTPFDFNLSTRMETSISDFTVEEPGLVPFR